ncbi:hypothetical protein GCM10009609_47840 [Pseudonocardia aurantiaca]|uniref:DUF5709 domain-containing protein n=1 Tax=Pseudonocardia aurantiaca TaxID=75290 RepID=A0ABW4FWQ2_9PSEU
MNQHDQDPSADYGYDLAHEANGTSQVPDDRPRHQHPNTPPASGTSDLDEDLSYDEAHDL